uniref:Uncharacterized protein n=1 Tax=Cacopsylla melanoneura TaxID=428564 RepID=A0A8D8U470_9HEMI
MRVKKYVAMMMTVVLVENKRVKTLKNLMKPLKNQAKTPVKRLVKTLKTQAKTLKNLPKTLMSQVKTVKDRVKTLINLMKHLLKRRVKNQRSNQWRQRRLNSMKTKKEMIKVTGWKQMTVIMIKAEIMMIKILKVTVTKIMKKNRRWLKMKQL